MSISPRRDRTVEALFGFRSTAPVRSDYGDEATSVEVEIQNPSIFKPTALYLPADIASVFTIVRTWVNDKENPRFRNVPGSLLRPVEGILGVTMAKPIPLGDIFDTWSPWTKVRFEVSNASLGAIPFAGAFFGITVMTEDA